MPYLTELKDLVQLHARAQGLPRSLCREVLSRIDHADGEAPGSWCREWARVADHLTEAGRHLDACRLNNLARFPYPSDPARVRAGVRCVSSFDRWRTERGGIDRLELELLGHRVPVWASGLDPSVPRPLLLLTGGIVSVKEQWAPILPLARGLGMAAIAAEMPGVGENPLRYERDSWRMFSGLLDTVAEIAPIHQVYSVAMSFSGHLALRWAANDPRLHGLVTVGAPVSAFFQDVSWWSRIPETTKRTLAHLTRQPVAGVQEHLFDFALRPAELSSVTVPVYSVISRRDEIIPAEDSLALDRLLARHNSIRFDDVHGSPNHVTRTKLWILRSLLQLRAGKKSTSPPRGNHG